MTEVVRASTEKASAVVAGRPKVEVAPAVGPQPEKTAEAAES
ncbi:MAG: hypothetical protein PHY05_03650 [Methanothrix sp.]|nr:hypothetical protein [Methanothrix sp.]